MRAAIVFLVTTMMSLPAFAEEKIVNAHFARRSLVIQIQDSETGHTKWISSAHVGIINESLGCSGSNCTARRLRAQDGGLYGDVVLSNEMASSLDEVFLVNFYEDTLIDPSDLVLTTVDGEYLISIRVR